MSVPAPATTRHGPLEGFVTRFAGVRARTSGAVELEAIPFLAQVDLRADPTDSALVDRLGSALGVALPLAPNTAGSDANGSRRVLWLSPDEWLILAPDGSATEIEASLRAALDGSPAGVVDVSANRAIVRLAGPAAREILEGGCSIDLHPRAFGPGRCVQTTLARAPIVILQVSTEPDFRLLVRPSFAAYLAAWLLDAIDGLG